MKRVPGETSPRHSNSSLPRTSRDSLQNGKGCGGSVDETIEAGAQVNG